MTTLQEAATQALVALNLPLAGNRTPEAHLEAMQSLRTALAQQGEHVAEIVHVKASGYPEIEWAYTARLHPSVGTKLYTAAPAALQPMTDAEIIEIAVNTMSAEPGRDGYVLPITFARAILEKVEATK